MKKKNFIIQSFLKHILYTSLVHQTPLRMRQIAPNCTIFSKFFWGGQTPTDTPQVASPLRGSPRAFGVPCATPGNVSATPGKNPSGSPANIRNPGFLVFPVANASWFVLVQSSQLKRALLNGIRGK